MQPRADEKADENMDLEARRSEIMLVAEEIIGLVMKRTKNTEVQEAAIGIAGTLHAASIRALRQDHEWQEEVRRRQQGPSEHAQGTSDTARG
jgi:hypothetical protein